MAPIHKHSDARARGFMNDVCKPSRVLKKEHARLQPPRCGTVAFHIHVRRRRAAHMSCDCVPTRIRSCAASASTSPTTSNASAMCHARGMRAVKWREACSNLSEQDATRYVITLKTSVNARIIGSTVLGGYRIITRSGAHDVSPFPCSCARRRPAPQARAADARAARTSLTARFSVSAECPSRDGQLNL